MRNRLFRWLLTASLAVILSRFSFAQVGTATLNGTLRDQSGAAIPGAAVILSGIEQQFARETVSDASGQYVLSAIPPGRYKLTSKAAGFRENTIDNIQLSGGQGSTLDVPMSVAEAAEQSR